MSTSLDVFAKKAHKFSRKFVRFWIRCINSADFSAQSRRTPDREYTGCWISRRRRSRFSFAMLTFVSAVKSDITSETAEIIQNLPLSYSYLFLKSLFAVSFEAFFLHTWPGNSVGYKLRSYVSFGFFAIGSSSILFVEFGRTPLFISVIFSSVFFHQTFGSLFW